MRLGFGVESLGFRLELKLFKALKGVGFRALD